MAKKKHKNYSHQMITRPHSSKEEISIQEKLSEVPWVFLLTMIFILGSFLRLMGAFTSSFAFTYDVGRDMLALANILNTHKISLIGFTTGLPGVFYGPWWYLFLLVPFILTGGNPQGIAVFIALTGIFTIWLVFVLGRKVSGTPCGMLLALFTAVSPALIASSSQIWNPNIAPLFVSIVFIVIVSICQSERTLWQHFLLLGLLLGFIFDIEIVFGTLFFISIIISLVVFLRKRMHIAHYSSIFAGILIIFSPRVLFEIRHQFLMTKTIISVLLQTTPHGGNVIGQFFQRIIFFTNLWADTLAGHNLLLAVIMLLFVIMTSIAFYHKVPKIQQAFLTMLWSTIIVYVLGLTVFTHDIWPHYTVGVPLVYVMLFGLCLSFWVRAKRTKFVVFAVSLLLFWINVSPLQLIADIRKPLFTGDASVYRNQLAVIEYVYQHANGQRFKYIVYTPPVYDYTYQYLFQWYGKKKYGYLPSKGNVALFFVILEPDSEKPFRLTGWLKERENDGKVIASQTMPSGITIQTRVVH